MLLVKYCMALKQKCTNFFGELHWFTEYPQGNIFSRSACASAALQPGNTRNSRPFAAEFAGLNRLRACHMDSLAENSQGHYLQANAEFTFGTGREWTIFNLLFFSTVFLNWYLAACNAWIPPGANPGDACPHWSDTLGCDLSDPVGIARRQP